MGKTKILIVDDEPDIRNLVKARFEFSGYDCLTAKDGEEAIRIATEGKPAAIVLDLIMPKMDGFEVYKVLKFNRATKNIPIIAYTAHPGVVSEKISQKRIELVDIVDILMKPFEAKVLVSAVEKAIGKLNKD